MPRCDLKLCGDDGGTNLDVEGACRVKSYSLRFSMIMGRLGGSCVEVSSCSKV